MNAGWLWVAGVGLFVLVASVAAAREPSISGAESSVFHAVNGLPDFLFPALWLPMQLGNLVVGTLAGLAVAARRPRPRRRHRRGAGDRCSSWSPSESFAGRWPTTSPSASDRGPARSAPSCAGGRRRPRAQLPVGSRHPRRRRRPASSRRSCRPRGGGSPLLLTVLVMVGRVYVGAHNPLDVTAGLGAGLLLGGVLAAFVE